MTPIETAAEKRHRQDADLRELAAMGMDLAREAHLAALQQIALPLPAGELDRAKTFATLSREIRGIIALERRLDAPSRPIARPHHRSARTASSRRPSRVQPLRSTEPALDPAPHDDAPRSPAGMPFAGLRPATTMPNQPDLAPTVHPVTSPTDRRPGLAAPQPVPS